MGISHNVNDEVRRIQRLADDIKRPSPPLRAGIIRIARFVIDNFRTGGTNAGGWQALSRGRKKRKVMEGYDGGILVYRGELKQRWGFIYSATSAAYQSFTRYSFDHAEGRGRNPQRKILPTEEQSRALVMPEFERWRKGLLDDRG